MSTLGQLGNLPPAFFWIVGALVIIVMAYFSLRQAEGVVERRHRPSRPATGARGEAAPPAATLIRNRYGGFWRRSLAWLIDQLILLPVVVGCSLVAAFATDVAIAVGDPHVSPSVAGSEIGEAFLLAFPIGYLVMAWLYYALLESSSKQSTYGKRLLRLVVTDETESRISFARASGRFWAKLLSGVLLIGFIVAAFTQKKQAFHDKLAGTLVLRRSALQLSDRSRQSPSQLVEPATATPTSPVDVPYRPNFCNQCGAKWEHGMFCSYCGAKSAA